MDTVIINPHKIKKRSCWFDSECALFFHQFMCWDSAESVHQREIATWDIRWMGQRNPINHQKDARKPIK